MEAREARYVKAGAELKLEFEAIFARLRKSLRTHARMQCKTCFNFKRPDEALFKELEQLTVRVMADSKTAGLISDDPAL